MTKNHVKYVWPADRTELPGTAERKWECVSELGQINHYNYAPIGYIK